MTLADTLLALLKSAFPQHTEEPTRLCQKCFNIAIHAAILYRFRGAGSCKLCGAVVPPAQSVALMEFR